MVTRSPVIWLAALSALALVSCSSGTDDLAAPNVPIASAVPGPSAVPTSVTVQSSPSPDRVPPTVAPLPTPVVDHTAIPGLSPTPIVVDTPTPEPNQNFGNLTVPVCRTSTFSSNGIGFGTVPHATSTPVPESGPSGQPAFDHSTFVAGMRPLYDALRAVTSAGDEAWSNAVSDQVRADSIISEGRRLSHLCSALSIVPRTTVSNPLFLQLSDSLKARRNTLFDAAELLRYSDSDFTVHEADRARTTSEIVAFGAALEEFASSTSVADSAGNLGYTIVNPLLELQVSVAPGWVTIRNGIDVFITAPPVAQRYSVSGLGPEAWKLGTALRVRRFRNESGRTLDEALTVLDSLLVRFGSRTDKIEFDIGGERGVRLTYSDGHGDWRTLVGATVFSDATYLFELGCPVEFAGECENALDSVLSNVTFNSR